MRTNRHGSTPRKIIPQSSRTAASIFSISDEMQMGLHQLAANKVQRLLCCPIADSLTGTSKIAFERIGLLSVAYSDVDQAYRLCVRAARGACDSRQAQAQRCARALTDAFRKCGG